MLQTSRLPKSNDLPWRVVQAQNQSDNIRKGYENELVRYEGVLPSVIPGSFGHSFARAGQKTRRH